VGESMTADSDDVKTSAWTKGLLAAHFKRTCVPSTIVLWISEELALDCGEQQWKMTLGWILNKSARRRLSFAISPG
jgi:hypothetical protein